MFLPNFSTRRQKGVIGTAARQIAIYAMDEKTILGYVTIRKSDEVPVGYQVFYRDGELLGACDSLSERMPLQPGDKPPDTIVFNPINYERVLRDWMDQRQRYATARAPTFAEKWPEAVEHQQRHRKNLH